MWLMLQQDEPDDYVIATGEMHTVREFVRGRLRPRRARLGATTSAIDARYFRPTEVDELCGDASKAARSPRLAADDDVPRARRADARARPARAGVDPSSVVGADEPPAAMSDFWPGRRVMVTGGAGFLGQAVVERLEAAGADEIFVPRSATTTCERATASSARSRDGRPDVVIHLAAVVGGIGANRENPGRFFYENAIMGIQLMEQARLAGVEKFVTDRHRLLVPEVHAGAVPRGRPLERLPGGDQRPLRPRQEDAARPGPGLPRSSTASTSSTSSPSTSTAPATTSTRRSSHVIPALIKKCVDARDAGADHIEVWGTGSRVARVPLRRRRRRGHRARRRALRRRRAGQPRRRRTRSRSAIWSG